MNGGEGPPASWTPARLTLKTAALQGVIAVFLWDILGLWNDRHSWLLEPFQHRELALFFLRDVTIGGLLIVVLLPALWIHRIADEASLDVAHQTAFLERVLAFPRNVALLDLVASVLIFFFGAWRLRLRAFAPAIETAKIAAFGFQGGILFGILSYFLLQPLIRPLLVAGLRQGAISPRRAGFPLTQKIPVACFAIAVVVTGHFGQLALSWAQRFAEARAEERARASLDVLARDAASTRPHDARGWKEFFARPRPSIGTVFVSDSYGNLLATFPEKLAGADKALVQNRDWRAQVTHEGNRTGVFRIGETRIVSVVPVLANWNLVLIVPPDSGVLRGFSLSATPVAIEILLISLILAIAVGRGLTRPLRDLEQQTREFARDPQTGWPELPPTDDEIGVLASSLLSMQEEIRSVQGRLRESERRAATAALLAGVAHEVRNPLFGITSTAAALEGELAGDVRVTAHLEVIRRESDRLARMMEEMLSLQRAPRPAGVPVALALLLEEAARNVRSRFASKSPTITTDAPADLLLANSDRGQIQSVFVNLFENAVLSSDHAVRVRCHARSDGGFAVIEVEDDGQGLAKEVRDRLFEPFVTSRPGGTGIGLAVCRQIVAEHGGSIAVSSGAAGGTVFAIRLPVAGPAGSVA